jgi:hypothetical protein
MSRDIVWLSDGGDLGDFSYEDRSVNFTLSAGAIKLIFVDESSVIPSYTISDMNIIGCSLPIVNQSAFVNSKRLVSAEPLVTKISSEWVPSVSPM